MSDKTDKQKGIGSKLLGLFVVPEEGGGDEEGKDRDDGTPKVPPKPTGDPVADDLIARYAGGAPARKATPPPPAAGRPGPAAPAGPTEKTQVPDSAETPVTGPALNLQTPAGVAPAQLDFPGIYQKRGLTADEQTHVERALTLLGNLPRETPQEIKRQIVAASLVAFGVPVDKIIEVALLKQRILSVHVQDGQRETQAFLEESGRRLRELEAEMARIKKIAEDQLGHQAAVAAACTAQKGRVEEVLTFFGADAVQRVRAASPRLRDDT